MAGTLIKAAAMFFVPAFLMWVTSELLGFDQTFMKSDALLQAMGEVFKSPTVGRTAVSLLWVCVMGVASAVWGKFVHKEFSAEAIPIVDSRGGGARMMLCSANDLEGRMFAGSSPEGQLTLRINRVQGSDVRYSLLRRGVMQNDGKGAFDQKDCTLLISDLSSPAHIVRDGTNLSLVAVDPQWTLRYFETK